MDYPDYLSIRKRSVWLGLIWLMGDRLYYAGLFGFLFTAIGSPLLWFQYAVSHRHISAKPFFLTVVGLLILCTLLFFCGPVLKDYARRRASVE